MTDAIDYNIRQS